jgi:hypothetical protein
MIVCSRHCLRIFGTLGSFRIVWGNSDLPLSHGRNRLYFLSFRRAVVDSLCLLDICLLLQRTPLHLRQPRFNHLWILLQ